MKTSELTGAALDWAVAKCESEIEPEYFNGSVWITTGGFFQRIRRNVFEPSTKWSQGGPIIEREAIAICTQLTRFDWQAIDFHGDITHFGPTPLIAAMRCYVASKLGDVVEIPEVLK